MRPGDSIFGILLAAALGAVPVLGAAQDADPIEQAREIVRRTKTVDATYSSYVWNIITAPDGSVVEEWAAEFHDGALHRVETPHDRVIANCRDMTGVARSLVTGETRRGPSVARLACGINTNVAFRSLRALGSVAGPGGTVDRIEVIDAANTRVYDVTGDGIIVRTTYASSEAPDAVFLEAWTFALERKVPAGDLFSEESLGTSFVADGFRQRPDPD